MSVWESLITSWQSILSTKMRSGLTMLSIVIGVAAVVFLVGLGRGQQASMTAMFEEMGANAIYITSTGSKTGGGTNELTLEDANALNNPERAPSVAVVAPMINRTVTVSYGNENVNVNCTGITPDIKKIRNYPVSGGTFVSERDVKSKTSVVVLGYQTAIDLFGTKSPLGENLRVAGRKFQVIGTIEELGGRPGSDDYILIPLTTMQSKIVAGKDVQTIAIQATNPEAVNAAIKQVTDILRQRHHIREGEENDFNVTNMVEILKSRTESLATFSIFLGCIGAIALFVGGIGIMNIMLVSVSERTREIGIRKAVGAKRRDILRQFLVEAAVLSLSGGIIGIIISLAGSKMVGGVQLIGRSAVEAQIEPGIIIIALTTSIGVGLISGTYPAVRAARMDPIESLRHE